VSEAQPKGSIGQPKGTKSYIKSKGLPEELDGLSIGFKGLSDGWAS